MKTEFEIIDFHTHPFIKRENNICAHTDFCAMSAESTKKLMTDMGVSRICGSVLGKRFDQGQTADAWNEIKACNNEALKLKALYGDFYIPGFHVHPDFVKESCEEIERMSKLGVKLVGELVPYYHGWRDYSCKNFYEILDVCRAYNMLVSFHSMEEDAMDKMVKDFPNVTFIAAHPGEYGEFMRHMSRMKTSENYYLDVSGYGMFRHGMLRHALDEFGAERFLFGSDYPTCSPAMYIGGVYFDALINDDEKRMIFSENAKRLLEI